MPHLSIAILQFPGATNFCCILCGASNGVATNSFRLNGFFAGQLTATPPLPTPTIGQVQAIAKTAAAAAATFNGRLPPSKSSGKTFRSLLATLKGISRLAALKPKTAKFSFFPHPTPYPLAALLLSFFFLISLQCCFFFFLASFSSYFYVGFMRAKFVLQFNDFALENCCAPMPARGGGWQERGERVVRVG